MIQQKQGSGIIQALDRGLMILDELIRAKGELNLPEIHSRFDWDRSTTFRLLMTLVRREYIVQSEETKMFRVGPKCFGITDTFLTYRGTFSIYQPFLRELSEISREMARLAVLRQNKAVVLDWYDSREDMTPTMRGEIIESLHCSALGKVLLAHLSQRRLKVILNEIELVASTPNAITDARLLIRHLKRIRKDQYAFDDEELQVGLRCLAAPVRDSTKRVVAAIGISGPVHRIGPGNIGRYVEIVQNFAFKVSRSLGY